MEWSMEYSQKKPMHVNVYLPTLKSRLSLIIYIQLQTYRTMSLY